MTEEQTKRIEHIREKIYLARDFFSILGDRLPHTATDPDPADIEWFSLRDVETMLAVIDEFLGGKR